MRYVIMGGGALGSVLGAHLVSGGERVTVVDDEPARIRALRRGGIRITGFRSGVTDPVETLAPQDLRDLAPLETVLVCVKPFAMETAVSTLLPFCNPETVFVSFTGGLTPFRLGQLAGAPRSVIAVANFEARLREGGEVETGFHNFIWLGELDGTSSDRLLRLQTSLSWVAPTLVTKVVAGMVWSKALYSLEVALSTVVDDPPLEVFRQPVARRLAAALVRENLDLADAAGVYPVAFDFFDPNLYRARTDGEGSVMDIWIKNAWARHEAFRDGFEYTFPAKAGISWSLSPVNPVQETTSLIGDLLSSAEDLSIPLLLTEQFGALYREITHGQRAQSWDNIQELARRCAALGISVPGPMEI